MPLWLLLLILILATHRVTRIIVDDSVLNAPRQWIFDKGPGWLAELLSCHWCVGWWVAGATVGLTWLFQPIPLPGLWWPAVASGAGLIQRLER